MEARTPPAVLIANPSADLYGSDRMAIECARALLSHGFRVVVTCSVDGPLVQAMQDLGAEVRVLPAPVIRKSMLKPAGLVRLAKQLATALPQMRKLVREVRPQFVLANTVTVPFWTAVGRLNGTRVLVYVHEAEASLRPLARKLLIAPLRFADGVIYNSETSRRVSWVNALERRGRTHIVYNGVPGPGTVVAPRSEINSPLRVVFVGRLSPRKGPDLLLEAAGMLRNDGIDVELELVGDVFPGYEWYENELRQRTTELGLTHRVAFGGFQSSVWEALARADVAVVPSRSDESFGNVVVEAALSGRPVVVADHSGLREASAGLAAAVRVPKDDAEAVAHALRRVVEEWPSLSASAIRDATYASDNYAPEQYQRRLLEAIDQLVVPSRRSRLQ
ncbi:glycosyltransferase [Leucobacter sp. HY1910]